MKKSKQEFNLSKKIGSIGNAEYLFIEGEEPTNDYEEVIEVKDIKEFIRLLKENINEFWTNGDGQCICPECWEHRDGTKETYLRTKDCMFLKMFEEIDKLAGDKLVEAKELK